jgi:hypothetical protein
MYLCDTREMFVHRLLDAVVKKIAMFVQHHCVRIAVTAIK